MKPDEFLISVCIITYNQKNFISDAIESALKQQTSFKYELVISDDCSTDGTYELCLGYQQKYPDIIRLKRNLSNQGMNRNWLNAIDSCSGKYLALCEGDDYWCDEYKLQKQVDFLEANPIYAIAFHRVFERKHDKLTLSNLILSDEAKTYSLFDLSKGNLIQTASVVFRKSAFPVNLPLDKFYALPAVDYPIFMTVGKAGKIKYMHEAMAVYRRHDGGVWSKLRPVHGYKRWLSVIDFLLQIDFENEVIDNLKFQKQCFVEKYLKELMNEADWQEFLQQLSFFSNGDEYISRKWLLDHYPRYIEAFRGSRLYRISLFLRKCVKRISG